MDDKTLVPAWPLWNFQHIGIPYRLERVLLRPRIFYHQENAGEVVKVAHFLLPTENDEATVSLRYVFPPTFLSWN